MTALRPLVSRSQRATAERFLLYWDKRNHRRRIRRAVVQRVLLNGIVAIPGIWDTATAYGHVTLTCSGGRFRSYSRSRSMGRAGSGLEPEAIKDSQRAMDDY